MEWLEVDAKSVEELIVTYENVTSDRELNHFNYLNLPSLSMLFLRETAPGIKFSEPWRHRESKFLEKEGLTYAELAKSVQDEAEVFTVLLDSKSRFVSLGRFTVSVLDRLPDGGASLTRLGLCLHFETQWVIKRLLYSCNHLLILLGSICFASAKSQTANSATCGHQRFTMSYGYFFQTLASCQNS